MSKESEVFNTDTYELSFANAIKPFSRSPLKSGCPGIVDSTDCMIRWHCLGLQEQPLQPHHHHQHGTEATVTCQSSFLVVGKALTLAKGTLSIKVAEDRSRVWTY